MKNKLFQFTATLLFMSLLGTACAQEQGERPRRGPPPEALFACQAKKEGDVCHFTGRFNETLVGVCHVGPLGEGELACRPKPPQEAFTACSGKMEGDACSFVGRGNNTVKGSCHKGPGGMGEIHCLPKERMQLPPDEEQQEAQPTQFD